MACLCVFEHYFAIIPGTIPVLAAPSPWNAVLFARRNRVGVTAQAS